jgi:hypothetical protein
MGNRKNSYVHSPTYFGFPDNLQGRQSVLILTLIVVNVTSCG